MSDNVNRINDTKEAIAKKEFVDLYYEKRMCVYNILEEKNMLGKLDNIATLINNKLVDIGYFFSNNGINFYSQSKLKTLIEKRLNVYYEKGCLELENGIEHESLMDLAPTGALDYKLTVLYNEELEKSYNKYKRYCKEVLNFNMLSHIIEDIIADFFESLTAQGAIAKLDWYKKELTTLGFGKLVPILENSLKKEVKKRLQEKENKNKYDNKDDRDIKGIEDIGVNKDQIDIEDIYR